MGIYILTGIETLAFFLRVSVQESLGLWVEKGSRQGRQVYLEAADVPRHLDNFLAFQRPEMYVPHEKSGWISSWISNICWGRNLVACNRNSK